MKINRQDQKVIEEFTKYINDNYNQSWEILCEKAKSFYSERLDLAAATLNLRRVSLKKAILNYARTTYNERLFINDFFKTQIPDNQVIKIIKNETLITNEELEIILTKCTKRISLVAEFIFRFGCKISEVMNIRLSDCIPSGSLVALRIMGKGRKERVLNIPADFFNKINEFYKGEIYLFETKTHSGKSWNCPSYYRELIRQGKNNLNKKVTARDIRHLFARTQLNQNKSIVDVALKMGNKDYKSTAERYHDFMNVGSI